MSFVIVIDQYSSIEPEVEDVDLNKVIYKFIS